jgi:hypothetical protein
MLISWFEFPVALYFTVIAGANVDFAKREKDKSRQGVIPSGPTMALPPYPKISRHISVAALCFAPRSPLFELALVPVRLDHIARARRETRRVRKTI